MKVMFATPCYISAVSMNYVTSFFDLTHHANRFGLDCILHMHSERRCPVETRENPEQRNEFCRSLITRKIEASILTLEKSIRRSDKWERAMKSAYMALTRLDENPPETIVDLRVLEANCAAP